MGNNYNQNLYIQLVPYLDELCLELSNYQFPGNVRQFYNILERFLILYQHLESHLNIHDCKNILLQSIDEQPSDSISTVTFAIKENYKDSVFEAEKSILLKYLEMSSEDLSSLSNKLGIGKTTLYRKLKEMNIPL